MGEAQTIHAGSPCLWALFNTSSLGAGLGDAQTSLHVGVKPPPWTVPFLCLSKAMLKQHRNALGTSIAGALFLEKGRL